MGGRNSQATHKCNCDRRSREREMGNLKLSAEKRDLKVVIKKKDLRIRYRKGREKV